MLVRVENNLVVDLLVSLDDDTVSTILVSAFSAGEFETAPGFALYFETLLPVAGQDPQGNDLLMGELVNGQFSVDVTGAGGSIAYVIENQVGDDIFFAPLPSTDKSRHSATNWRRYPGCPDPPGRLLPPTRPRASIRTSSPFSYSARARRHFQANALFVSNGSVRRHAAFNPRSFGTAPRWTDACHGRKSIDRGRTILTPASPARLSSVPGGVRRRRRPSEGTDANPGHRHCCRKPTSAGQEERPRRPPNKTSAPIVARPFSSPSPLPPSASSTLTRASPRRNRQPAGPDWQYLSGPSRSRPTTGEP